MARSIFFALLLATATLAYVQAVPVSEELARGDIPAEEFYPELAPQRGDTPIEELYPSDDEAEAEIAKFKDDLKKAWRKIKDVVKSKYEEIINNPKLRKTLKDSANKLVDKTKQAVEKALESVNHKLDKIVVTNSPVPSAYEAEPEVTGIKDKAEDVWNNFKNLVKEKYEKIMNNPNVKHIMEEAEKAVTKAKETINNIVEKVRQELEKAHA